MYEAPNNPAPLPEPLARLARPGRRRRTVRSSSAQARRRASLVRKDNLHLAGQFQHRGKHIFRKLLRLAGPGPGPVLLRNRPRTLPGGRRKGRAYMSCNPGPSPQGSHALRRHRRHHGLEEAAKNSAPSSISNTSAPCPTAKGSSSPSANTDACGCFETKKGTRSPKGFRPR